MRKAYLALPLLALPLIAAACMTRQPSYRDTGGEPTTVDRVNLTRYAGTWYEIARYPNGFEKNCVKPTAEYSLNEDGTVKVVNTCIDTETGKADRAEGTARVVEGSNNSKLKVKFAPDWVPFASGDYWILALEEDYSAALVGSPDGKYLWILAREAQPDQTVIDRMLAAAEAKGFETEPLIYTQ
ncbi:lipocalin family protein [Henriciella litoralis]|uniref:lipocalin family protein n=1 Tax=Henriciella litoralis TaxID=568102 RepID=UPI000A026D1C|nr:lipocalin family protein [Henriciella litoralis]